MSNCRLDLRGSKLDFPLALVLEPWRWAVEGGSRVEVLDFILDLLLYLGSAVNCCGNVMDDHLDNLDLFLEARS